MRPVSGADVLSFALMQNERTKESARGGPPRRTRLLNSYRTPPFTSRDRIETRPVPQKHYCGTGLKQRFDLFRSVHCDKRSTGIQRPNGPMRVRNRYKRIRRPKTEPVSPPAIGPPWWIVDPPLGEREGYPKETAQPAARQSVQLECV